MAQSNRLIDGLLTIYAITGAALAVIGFVAWLKSDVDAMLMAGGAVLMCTPFLPRVVDGLKGSLGESFMRASVTTKVMTLTSLALGSIVVTNSVIEMLG